MSPCLVGFSNQDLSVYVVWFSGLVSFILYTSFREHQNCSCVCTHGTFFLRFIQDPFPCYLSPSPEWKWMGPSILTDVMKLFQTPKLCLNVSRLGSEGPRRGPLRGLRLEQKLAAGFKNIRISGSPGLSGRRRGGQGRRVCRKRKRFGQRLQTPFVFGAGCLLGWFWWSSPFPRTTEAYTSSFCEQDANKSSCVFIRHLFSPFGGPGEGWQGFVSPPPFLVCVLSLWTILRTPVLAEVAAEWVGPAGCGGERRVRRLSETCLACPSSLSSVCICPVRVLSVCPVSDAFDWGAKDPVQLDPCPED